MMIGGAIALRGAEAALYLLPMGGLFISWLLPPERATWLESLLHVAVIPILAALAVIRIELFVHFALWPMLLFIVLAGDGRWIGAWLGAMLLGGRRALRTMRLVIGVMSCGPTQLAVAVIAAHADLLDESLLLAIVFSATVLEVLTPARRTFAQRIARTEAELNDRAQQD
jgi:hypothetical protein